MSTFVNFKTFHRSDHELHIMALMCLMYYNNRIFKTLVASPLEALRDNLKAGGSPSPKNFELQK